MPRYSLLALVAAATQTSPAPAGGLPPALPQTGSYTWNFQDPKSAGSYSYESTGHSDSSNGGTPAVGVGTVFPQQFALPTNANPSAGYAGASGSFNLPTTASASAGVSDSWYAITLFSAYGLIRPTGLNFGVRSQTDGATRYAIRAGVLVNGVFSETELATGTIAANTTWQAKTTTFNTPALTTQANQNLEFRLYVYGAASSTFNNTAIDDVVLSYAVTPVPEPTGVLAVAAAGLVVGQWLTRRRPTLLRSR